MGAMVMEDTNEKELLEAIRRFKEREGIQTPLDMFKLDDIIIEIREEAKKEKK